MKKDTGGYAFPMPLGNEDISPDVAGMTLRDYIAIKAMAALISGAIAPGAVSDKGTHKSFSNAAFSVADAMLKARGE